MGGDGVYGLDRTALPEVGGFHASLLVSFQYGVVNVSGEIVAAADRPTTTDLQALEKFFISAEKDVEGAILDLHAFPQEVLVRVSELHAHEGWQAFAASPKKFRRVQAHSSHAGYVVKIKREFRSGCRDQGKPIDQFIDGGGFEESGSHRPDGIRSGFLGCFHQGAGVGQVVVTDVSDVN